MSDKEGFLEEQRSLENVVVYFEVIYLKHFKQLLLIFIIGPALDG